MPSGERTMKKGIESKNDASTIGKESHAFHSEKMALLRTLGEQESFYFYEAIGKPTGIVARNLSDFLDKVKVVKSESLVFHFRRGDFQNWIDKTLGDPVLAKKLAGISSSKSPTTIRTHICKIIRSHMGELNTLSREISIANTGTAISIRT